MQFSAFIKTISGTTTLLKNELPIQKVGSIKFYTETATGSFTKKEFRWSFNTTYWSAWQTLNQHAFASINTHANYFLFLEFRYVGTGTVSSIVVNYTEGAVGPVPTENHIHTDIETFDVSAKVIHDVIQQYDVIRITDASLLNGYPGSWYLDRRHHTGQQTINTIIGLQALLNSLVNSGLAVPVNVPGLGYGTFDRQDGSTWYFRKLNPSTGIVMSENAGIITISAPIIDPSSTVSPTFQLNRNNLGVKIKDVSGNLEVRDSSDSNYSGFRAKSVNIGTPSSIYMLNVKEDVVENLLSSYYVIDTFYGFGGTYSHPPTTDPSIVNGSKVYSNTSGDKCIYKVGNTWFLQALDSSSLSPTQTHNWSGPFWFNEGSLIGAYFGNSAYYGKNITVYGLNDLYKRAVGVQGNVDILGNLGVHGKIIAEALKLDPSWTGVLVVDKGEVGLSPYAKSKNYDTSIYGPGLTTFNIDHSLNTYNHTIIVYDKITDDEIFPDKTRGLNTSVLEFNTPLGLEIYDVIVIGY